MSYSRRGSSCNPQTIACTTAQKYLPLKAPTYKQWGMYMYRFPGDIVQPSLHPVPVKPEGMIQTYYGKIYDHTSDLDENSTIHITTEHEQDPTKQYTKPSCKNC